MDYRSTEQFREYGILLARIDDRLVHGQVVAGWNRILRAQYITVISEAVAADDFRKSMVENAAAPGDLRVSVLTPNEALIEIRSGAYKNGGAILLFENPGDVYHFLQLDGLLDIINVGGMHQAAGKTEYATALWLDEKDIAFLLGIEAMGKKLFYQMVPMEGERDVIGLINEK